MSRRAYGMGLLIVALGVVWLLNNLGVTAIDAWSLLATYWPVLLVVWGLDLLRGATEGWKSERIGGLLVLALGLAILGRNIGWYQFDFSVLWRLFWPLVLIAVGLLVVVGPARTGNIHWGVMGGLAEKSPGWRLSSGSYIAFMGGVELDLTRADIPRGRTVLDLTAVMGAVELRIPRDLPIEMEGTAVLGGVELLHNEAGGILARKRWVHSPEDPDASGRMLVVHARSVMGSVEIKEG